MSTTTLYETTPQTGTVSSTNLTTLYSNTTSFTTGVVNSAVYSVNGSTGVTVNPTTGNVVVSIGQDVATTANVTFANVTATGNLSNNYFTLANSAGTNGQVLTTNGAGVTSWTSTSGLGLVNSVTGSGAGISVSPTTGAVIVSNTGVTSAVAGTGIGVSAGTGAVTITNSGVTSIVAGTNITVSGATGAVTVNATGDVVGPSSATDNAAVRFNTTTGKLIQNSSFIIEDLASTIVNVSAGTGNYLSLNTDAANPTTLTRDSATTNANIRALVLRSTTTGTPALGIGTSLSYETETAVGVIKNSGFVQTTSTDLTSGSEDFRMNFGLMQNGAAAASRLKLYSNGDLDMFDGGKFAIVGLTTGYSQFGAPTNGSNLTYTLPGAAGAANTVLTNNGSGVLSWALPGGGGSTFGNITIAVATDNTISTTTGDLVLTSATNLIDASTADVRVESLTIDTRSTIDSTTITTTSTATVLLVNSTRNAMSVLVNIIQGTNVHCVNATVLRVDATTAMVTTYGEMYNNISLASFTADVSGGALRLLITPTSSTSTLFTCVRTSLT